MPTRCMRPWVHACVRACVCSGACLGLGAWVHVIRLPCNLHHSPKMGRSFEWARPILLLGVSDFCFGGAPAQFDSKIKITKKFNETRGDGQRWARRMRVVGAPWAWCASSVFARRHAPRCRWKRHPEISAIDECQLDALRDLGHIQAITTQAMTK